MSAEWHPLAVDYGVYDPLMTGSIDGTDTRPHDRAVTRAYQASYKPCLQISGDPEKTIFIGRLHMNTAEETIKEKFAKFGKIRKCTLVRDLSELTVINHND
jgi:U11/U12 small nuclear ribonucleoprotein SNRNP35